MTPQSELSAQSRDTSAAESEFTATGWVARVDQWYMSKPFAIKTKIATALGVGGLVLVALIAVIGLMNPQYSTYFAVAIVIVTVAFAFSCLSAVSFILSRIVYPFVSMAEDMESVSFGERNINVRETSREDEIGQMARALESFVAAEMKVETLNAEKEAARAEQEAARKAAEDTRKEELLRLADQFEESIGGVVDVVAVASGELQQTANEMAASADQTLTQVDSATKSMDEGMQGATTAAAASDEFAMSMGEISRQAETSAEFARDASRSAEKADETIKGLSSSAAHVEEIIDLISSIAQRTNLLALNASIEAARGGEAGRGFAVVASEVKELATQTAAATERVTAQVQGMRSSTDASVAALEMIADKIVDLEKGATAIAAAVDQQSVAGKELARSIDMAARASNTASEVLGEVRKTSETTEQAANEVSGSAERLDTQAVDLREKANGFLAHIRAG
ncbi:methyl-accepting chemotaxis protein [Parasphingorhabdus sp.]